MLTGGTSFSRSGYESDALALGVDAWGGSGFEVDADATRYIEELGTAGVVPTDIQRNAINAFVKSEKSTRRWDLHKRIYLPIWGVTAANAICLRSLTSGTFVGGVTHSAGYVQGNGTSGYFNFGVSPSILQIGPMSEMAGVLVYTAGAAGSRYISAQTGTAAIDIAIYAGGGGTVSVDRSVHVAVNANIVATGIISVSRTSSSAFFVHQRRAGVTSAIIGPTTTSSQAITHNIYAGARNNSGVLSQWSTAQFGAFFAGLGIDSSGMNAFTANLKNLWETCTGLTLP